MIKSNSELYLIFILGKWYIKYLLCMLGNLKRIKRQEKVGALNAKI